MYYSPILFSRIADVEFTNYKESDINIDYLNSKDRIIIFCLHSMFYIEKISPLLDKITKPFVLISAMEDTQLPLEINPELLNRIIENKYFKHWFSINKTIPNDNNFTCIPYGLDYWTLTIKPYWDEPIQSFETQDNNIRNIINETVHFSQRIPKIYATFHLNKTDERHGDWRSKLPSIIPSNIIYYQPRQLKRSDCYKKMSEYAFVVSPFGNGFDCIRTFEALCLGCIVIMKKSFLDIIYEELPVLLVDEWSDINEQLLKDALILYSNKQFNYEKLNMNYWIYLVNSKF